MKLNRLPTLLVLLVLGVLTVQAFTFSKKEANTTTLASAQSYGHCPDPAVVCELFHPGSILTGFCEDGACFEMSYGSELRLVAADDLGPFPKIWFAWPQGSMNGSGPFPCNVTQQNKNKTVVEIPALRCQADLVTDNATYHEHFASNPNTGCLGWVECRENPLAQH